MKPPQPDPEICPTERGATVGGGRFAEIVETHWAAVFRFLLTMTGNHHDTEELTQETFLRALRRADSFQAGTQIRPWLLRVAANACRDLWRKRNRSRTAPLANDPPGPAGDVGMRLETREEAQLLRVAMDELSDTTRAVFHLRVQESLPFRQIGEMLDLSEDAARWHMHQARTKLLARMRRD